MNAIKKACKIIKTDPTSPMARTLANFVVSLESEAQFPLGKLYDMDLRFFALAMKIMREWRLDRFHPHKDKLLDVSYQLNSLSAH